MSAPQIEVVEANDPGLAVRLEAKPPVVGKGYKDTPVYAKWTLDLMERTLFEFRTAGAWDTSEIEMGGYPSSVKCEVMAGRAEDAMPWGWRPSDGAPRPAVLPAATPTMNRTLDDVIPAFLGNRTLHGLLLIALVVLAVFR